MRAAFTSTLLASLVFAQPAVQAPPERWVLVYSGGPYHPRYSADDLSRLLAAVDTTGRPTGPLCTAVVLTEFEALSGRFYMPWPNGAPATGADWDQYIDSLVSPAGPLVRLDSAVARAGVFGERRLPVAIMVPFPNRRADTLRFAGRTFTMASETDRAASVTAYMETIVARVQPLRLPNLTISAFYWLNEGVADADTSLVARAAAASHRLNMRFLWIPSWGAPNATRWRDLGFDDAWQQPNYFFHPDIPAARLDSAVDRARGAAMGLELEFDRRLFSDAKFADRLGPYLAAMESAPDLRRRSIAIYEGAGGLIDLSRRADAASRALYARLVAVLQGETSP